MIRGWIKAAGPFVTGLVGAMIGAALLLMSAHVYQDHALLHQVVTFINQQGGKIVALPAK